MQTNLYASTAQFYDKGNEIKDYTYDIDFYKSLVNDDTNVLELGCGTGRITLSLIDKCRHITGVELSDQMLHIHKIKITALNKELQEKIKLVHGDMTNFDLDRKYDLIMFPGITFQALTTNEQRNNCLECTKSHLSDGGKIILDFMHPDPERVKRTGNSRVDFEYFDKDLDCTITKHSVIEHHDENNQVHKIKYTFVLRNEAGVQQTIEDYFELGYLYPMQIEQLFKENGFKVEKVYGWYDKSMVDMDQKRMLIYVLSMA